MKQIVPIVLAVLMMSSVLAVIDTDELKDTKEMDTDGRADYELKLHDVLEPRETFVDQAGNTRNGIDVGQDVTFRPIILNDGDNNQTEFNIRVTVAPAADESILIIDNTDSAVCPGGASVGCNAGETLEPRQYLGGGAYDVHTQAGDVLTWTPSVPGVYVVTVSVETVMSAHDTDLTNNDISFEVVVAHYHDIQVDLCWTDGPGGECLPDETLAQGAGSHSFGLTVNSSGSESWDAREVTIEISMDGQVDAATSDFEGTLGASHTLVHGISQLVDVFHNESNPEQTDPHQDNPCPTNANPCNQSRMVAPFGQVTTYHGSVGADSASSGGTESFSVTARLISFVTYEPIAQDGSLVPGNESNNSGQSIIWTEQQQTIDDRSGNNDDELQGYFNVFHDVALTSLTGGTNEATEGTLPVGHQLLRANVIPSGSDLQQNSYDWYVTWSIIDENDVELLDQMDPMLSQSNSCVVENFAGTDNYDPTWSAEHELLGNSPPAVPEGYACIEVQLDTGLYDVRAEVTFVDASTTDADPGNDCNTGGNPACQEDMNGGNDVRGTSFEVINGIPSLYMSLDRVTRGEDAEEVALPVVVGDTVTLNARGSDSETPDELLRYSWTRTSALGGVMPIDCQEGPDSGQCTDTTDDTWIGQRVITATVTDEHGASDSDSLLVSVWSSYSVDIATTGASMSYSMVYSPSVIYNMSATDADQVLGADLGTSGNFNSVVAMDVTASHLFSPSDVSGESLSVTYDAGNVDDDYDLWYYRAGTAEWTALGATKTAASNGGVTLVVDRSGASLPNMESGLYAIFATSNDGSTPPATGVQDLMHDLKPGAQIDLTWSLTDSSLANVFMDLTHVYYCVDSGSGCDALGGTHDKVAVTQTTHTITGTDASTYNVVVRVENGNTDSGSGDALFHASVGTTTVTADGSVSPSPAVADLAANAKDLDSAVEGPDALGFTWTATGTDDVQTWMICWAAYQFPEGDWSGLVSSGSSCVETTDDTMSSDVTELVICGGECNGQLYFGVAGVDGTKNVDSAEASYFYDATNPNTAPPTTTEEEAEETSDSDTPKQAMYAIIALVVLAVIGGAFILTRGGGGEGEDKEWDY